MKISHPNERYKEYIQRILQTGPQIYYIWVRIS